MQDFSGKSNLRGTLGDDLRRVFLIELGRRAARAELERLAKDNRPSDTTEAKNDD